MATSSSRATNEPVVRCLRGVISYATGSGRITGRERFELIEQSGGHVLRAFSEMDDAGLTRDVTLRMDDAWHPQDGFCRIVHADGRTTSLWFDIGQDKVQLDGSVDGIRLEPQLVSLDQPLNYLGLHPLQGDALIVNQRGVDRPGEYVAIPAVTNSISPNGDEAVGLCQLAIDVAYHGPASVTVAAGTFAARHYSLRWSTQWPPADVWVRQNDCVLLRMAWPYLDAVYELTELHES